MRTFSPGPMSITSSLHCICTRASGIQISSYCAVSLNSDAHLTPPYAAYASDSTETVRLRRPVPHRFIDHCLAQSTLITLHHLLFRSCDVRYVSLFLAHPFDAYVLCPIRSSPAGIYRCVEVPVRSALLWSMVCIFWMARFRFVLLK